MKLLPKLLAVAVVLACCRQVSARTVSHEVTPKNLNEQPYAFKVTIKQSGDAKEVEIRVATKSGGAPTGAGENGSLSVSTCGKKKPVETPPLTIVRTAQALVYTFRISNRDLERANVNFTFAVPDPGDYYQINLDDFLPAEETPTNPTDLPKPKFDESGKKNSPETFLPLQPTPVPSKTVRAASGK